MFINKVNIAEAFLQVRTAASAKRPGYLHPHSPVPYLTIPFRNVEDPVVVEVADGLFLEVIVGAYHLGDDGIGSFEYHGFKGNHSRPFVEVDAIEPLAINGEQVDAETFKMLIQDFADGRIRATCEDLPHD